MRSSNANSYHLKNRNGHFKAKPLRVQVPPGCSHPPLKQLEGRTGTRACHAVLNVGCRGAQQDENECCFFLGVLEEIIHQRDKCLFSVL